MARYQVDHLTRYDYSGSVTASHHAANVQPAQTPWQSVENFSLKTNPPNRDLRARRDYYGNHLHLFSIESPHNTLEVHARSEVEVTRQAPGLSLLSTPCKEVRIWAQTAAAPLEVRQYTYASPRLPEDRAATAWASDYLKPNEPLFPAVRALTTAIKESFAFSPDATTVDTSTREFLRLKKGVCQDFTHFMLAALRGHGIPARYVSGYILTHPPEGQERLTGADASHAWVSVYEPNFGWIDFDPTNDLVVTDEHITVAWGRDFSDVSMIRGAVRGGGTHELEIEVTVMPLTETATTP